MKRLALKTALRACCTSIQSSTRFVSPIDRPPGNMKTLMVSVLVLALLFSSAHGALRVENARKDGINITITNLPGCCSYCTGPVCPKICEACRPVVIGPGKTVTLEPPVGPYPLESLQVQSTEGGVPYYYCAGQSDRKYFTENALLQVGSGSKCGSRRPSLDARIVIKDSGTFEICMFYFEC